MKSIGVFLSSLTPKLNLDNDLDMLAGFISESKLKLVYGGGKRGLMGELSEKVSNKNGKIKYFWTFRTFLRLDGISRVFLTPSPDLWLVVLCKGKIIHQKSTFWASKP